MKSFLFTVCVFLIGADIIYASNDSTAVNPWKLGWIGTLNGSQATYRNWSQGGVNTVAVTGGTRFTAKYAQDRFVLDHSTSLKYGRARLNGNVGRKTDDEVRIRNQASRQFDNPHYSLITQLNFDTQFYEGYDRAYANIISKFMAPAYITETVGFAYTPEKNLQFNAGLSLKQTIVADTLLSPRYGLKDGTNFRNEGGVSLGFRISRQVMTNVSYSGSADTFTNLLRPVSSTVVKMNNDLVGKINNYLTTNIQFAVIFDDNVTKKLQVKQVLSVGFSYTTL
nr:DUF3078 domain-containing protein [Pseudoxanthomonas sp.]